MITVKNGVVKIEGTRTGIMVDYALLTSAMREEFTDDDLEWIFDISFKNEHDMLLELVKTFSKGDFTKLVDGLFDAIKSKVEEEEK